MNLGRYVHAAFGDDTARLAGVVDNDPVVTDRHIELEQVVDSGGVATPDGGLGDVVSARFNPQPDPFNGKFRNTQPQEHQRDHIPAALGVHHDPCQGFGGEGGFDSEIFPSFKQLVHPFRHQLAGLDGRQRRIEWGEALCNLVGIDELLAVQQFRQQGVGCRRFPGAVAARYDEHRWHFEPL